MSTVDEFLTFAEAAQIVRCTTDALRERWRREKLPVTRFGLRRVLLRRDDLMAYLRERSVR